MFLESVETCLARVAERVARGGHDVPEADVRRRYTRSLANFWGVYRPMASGWHLIYNGADGFRVVASQSDDRRTFHDEGLFDLFRSSLPPDVRDSAD